MKIAQIAPLYESVPPKMYGGTERVVCYLTDELIKQGHEVTLFASGDSQTKAKLVSNIDDALRLKGEVENPLAYHIVQMQEVIERMHHFDILHFHTDYLHYPFTYNNKKICLTTLHGRLDLQDLQHVYRKFPNQPVISISDAQRQPLPQANWISTVYHGLPLDLYHQGEGDGDFVAFLGRISPEKRVDRAIEIAAKAGIKIKIAAKIDRADQPYYEASIKKLFDQPHVEFLGEVNETVKEELLSRAKALLFPIDWPEPFGMVMIEAMACGTPIVAYDHGSVREIINEGKTGYIVNDIASAVKAVDDIAALNRNDIRKVFEKRFSAVTMAAHYASLYGQLLEEAIKTDYKNGRVLKKESALAP